MQDPKKPPPTDAEDEPPIGLLPDGTLNVVNEDECRKGRP